TVLKNRTRENLHDEVRRNNATGDRVLFSTMHALLISSHASVRARPPLSWISGVTEKIRENAPSSKQRLVGIAKESDRVFLRARERRKQRNWPTGLRPQIGRAS